MEEEKFTQLINVHRDNKASFDEHAVSDDKYHTIELYIPPPWDTVDNMRYMLRKTGPTSKAKGKYGEYVECLTSHDALQSHGNDMSVILHLIIYKALFVFHKPAPPRRPHPSHAEHVD
eukprot:gene7317-9324_t